MKTKYTQVIACIVALTISTLTMAQCSGCLNGNGDFGTYTAPPQSTNTWINNHLSNWFASHGTPTFDADKIKLDPSDSEGIYTEFNFIAGNTYTICYDLKAGDNSLPNSSLNLELSNGLSPNTSGSNTLPSTGSNQSLTSQPFSFGTQWSAVTETFTATSNFNQLWFFSFELPGEALATDYVYEIDNVCIIEGCNGAVSNFHLIHENQGDGKILAFDQSYANNGYEIISRTWTVETIATDRDYYPGGGTFNYIAPVSDHYLICLEVISVNEAGECCKDRFCEWIYIDVDSEPCNMEASFGYSCFTDDCIFKFSGNQDNSNRNVRTWFWDFGDGTTGEGQYPVKTYAAPGQYEVCLTVIGDNDVDGGECCYTTYCRTINFNCKGIDYAVLCDEDDPGFNPSEGMIVAPNSESSNPRQTFELFPNPTNNELNIQLDQDLSTGKLTVTDLSGKLVMERAIRSRQEVINVSQFESGIYLITLHLEDGSTLSKRFVKED